MKNEFSTRSGVGPSPVMTLAGRFRGATLLVALLILSVVMATTQPGFRTLSNLQSIFLSAAIIALLAAVQAIVVVSGNIDLSVGSVVGLVAYSTGLFLEHRIPMLGAIALVLLLGALLGFVNGFLVGVGRAPAIVVTIATLNIYRGILVAETHGNAINAYNVPTGYLDIASRTFFGLSQLDWIAVLVIIALSLFVTRTVVGRRIYALGGNPVAAETIGFSRVRLTILVFTVSGLISAVGGILWGAQYATVDSTAATGLEFTIITAVVLGGVNIFGGSGSVLGAAIGALFLATASDALSLLSVSQFWLGAIFGGLILAAVVTDSSLRNHLSRISLSGRR